MVSEQKPKGKRILFVEDEMTYRTLLQSVLRKAGHQCVICINGEFAINKLESEKFDLMILDYVLPGRNALEVIRWAREHNILTPAFIITGYPSDELASRCNEYTNVKLLLKSDINASDIPAIIAKGFTGTAM